jgi:hypothetical protein
LSNDQIEIDFWHPPAGNLHVSLPTDIIQLFGTSSVPVVVAGSVLGVFELGERLASQRAKDALSNWLVAFDIQKAKALPDGTQQIFERIFGERHFSLKCFMRSAVFSLCAIAFIGILLILIYPKAFSKAEFWHGDLVPTWLAFTVWFPWSILIDYLSLFKTRVILGILTRMRRRTKIMAIPIVGADYIVYKLLFSLGVTLMLAVENSMKAGIFLFANVKRLTYFVTETMSLLLMSNWAIWTSNIDLFSIFFWAGFAPSLWLWLYVIALFTTRAILRSEKLVNWLRWVLDVEKNPFRSIGAVAATLAFIVSVAIILVSVEVSRISNAS